MAKKSGGSKPKGSVGKSNKPKKGGMFKALKKQEKRTAVVGVDKNDPHSKKRKAKVAKRPATVSDELRSFDERMAAKTARRPGAVPKVAAVAPPTFVMAAPTFQLNLNPVQPTPAPREVEGFRGFMSALEAPKDAPVVNPNRNARQPKTVQPKYRGSNVFAMLEDEDEEQQKTQMASQPAPTFMQPATFTFATAKPTLTLQSSLQSSLRQNMQPVAVTAVLHTEDIDPDL
ncbi:uncharacterized protein PITG_14585 [Phytophthora infestans T30-4]|uniref:Uncharacterized protein n=2 Tax=Phytophthora infestans TaxID=4787 RepID=D0NQL7_PHYIT|nr:uncharacterized protein PITG_14585 [Phytophthora infestans T30-4]EEY62965.1 conserved hypothetical protein [Phytophthora infestans T30-4]KAF4034077.1 hypothetical protein GN244_ATG13960 [Phytophthora infestans]KAF4143868.1 hypothetical protein GN958_ATG06954 [Phytophthora infestans]|eukprot:XP_002898488.1 conserved hypothetical protein [Phytophthora infestans T30-4]